MARQWVGKFIEELDEDIFPIEESEYDFISKNGNIYKYCSKDNKFYKRKTYINKHNGYVYVAIRPKGEAMNKNRRVHVLLAKAFLDNTCNYTKVGHKNNNKQDNRLDNLY